MKKINFPQFTKTLAMLLVMTGLSVACAVVKEPPSLPIVAVPLLSAPEPPPEIEPRLQLVLETVLFEFDKASLLPEGLLKVKEFSQIIQQHESRRVVVAGHADSIGEKSYNMKLSERRAYTVRDALIANGVSPDRLITKAFGENKPIVTNTTEKGRQQNRRVEVTILN
jgi:outer membrane protein OmpA-like peptidoglycan-associated protein